MTKLNTRLLTVLLILLIAVVCQKFYEERVKTKAFIAVGERMAVSVEKSK